MQVIEPRKVCIYMRLGNDPDKEREQDKNKQINDTLNSILKEKYNKEYRFKNIDSYLKIVSNADNDYLKKVQKTL